MQQVRDQTPAEKWLSRLAVITSPGNGEAVTLGAIATMGTLIGLDFPPDAFTIESLAAVAAESAFWPSYADLGKRLGAWWREHKPAGPVQISDDRVRRLSEADQAWLAYWRKHRDQRWQEQRRMIATLGDQLSPEQLPMAKLRSLVRGNSPAAWALIESDEFEGVAQ